MRKSGTDKLEGAYALKTPQDNAACYRDFSDSYDQGFAAELTGRIDALQETWNDLLERPRDEETLLRLQRDLHSLVGAASSFGFQSIAEATCPLAALIASIHRAGNRTGRNGL